VDVANVAEPLAAVPFGRRGGPLGAAVDSILQRDGTEAPPRQHLHRLRISIRDREAEIAQRVVGLLGIDRRHVQVERLRRVAEV
jgi:hypothetical protein